MQDNIKLATRESPLALRQANIVREHLLDNNVFNKIDIVAMSTSGDRADNETFKRNGGKGLFLKELENALIEGKAHIACLLYTSPSPRDGLLSRMPSSA